MRRCIKRWQETGRIDDKESISRSAKKTKITTLILIKKGDQKVSNGV